MASRYVKRCSTSLIVNEIHFKTLRYHLLPLRMSVIKRQEITRAGKDVEIRETLYTVGGTVNWWSHSGKQYGASSKNNRTFSSSISGYQRH